MERDLPFTILITTELETPISTFPLIVTSAQSGWASANVLGVKTALDSYLSESESFAVLQEKAKTAITTITNILIKYLFLEISFIFYLFLQHFGIRV